MKTLLIIFLFTFISCSNNKPLPKGLSDIYFKLSMAVYKKGWVDGANASTGVSNSGGSWNPETGKEKFQKDSLAFVGFLYSN